MESTSQLSFGRGRGGALRNFCVRVALPRRHPARAPSGSVVRLDRPIMSAWSGGLGDFRQGDALFAAKARNHEADVRCVVQRDRDTLKKRIDGA